MSPQMKRRVVLWAEIKMAYKIMKQTLKKAKRLQAKHPMPGLAKKINELQHQVDKMESIFKANDGMGAFPLIAILIAIGATAVLGLVGVVGIKDLIKRVLPEIKEDTLTKWLWITAGATVVGVGLHAALSKRPVSFSASTPQPQARYRPSSKAAAKEGR